MKHNYFIWAAIALIALFTACTYQNEEDWKKEHASTDSVYQYDTKGLVAYFSFDNSLTEKTNNGQIAEAENTVSYSNTTRGAMSKACLYLNGNNSIKVLNQKYDTLTVCFWLKSEQQLKLLSDPKPVLVDIGQGATVFEVDGTTGASDINLTVGDQKTEDKTNTIDTYTEWNLVIIEIVKDGVNKLIFYNKINGEDAWRLLPKNIDYKNGQVYIGKSSTNKGFFKGYIDDLLIYKRSLTKDERENLKKI